MAGLCWRAAGSGCFVVMGREKWFRSSVYMSGQLELGAGLGECLNVMRGSIELAMALVYTNPLLPLYILAVGGLPTSRDSRDNDLSRKDTRCHSLIAQKRRAIKPDHPCYFGCRWFSSVSGADVLTAEKNSATRLHTARHETRNNNITNRCHQAECGRAQRE